MVERRSVRWQKRAWVLLPHASRSVWYRNRSSMIETYVLRVLSLVADKSSIHRFAALWLRGSYVPFVSVATSSSSRQKRALALFYSGFCYQIKPNFCRNVRVARSTRAAPASPLCGFAARTFPSFPLLPLFPSLPSFPSLPDVTIETCVGIGTTREACGFLYKFPSSLCLCSFPLFFDIYQ